ncbi:hypothetical protein E8E14_003803 [Neopestalotiopsis sp. 37M]|nr:hypothetical protein E8E14_003803 [Neopestalotiopsis sp. 37M]
MSSLRLLSALICNVVVRLLPLSVLAPLLLRGTLVTALSISHPHSPRAIEARANESCRDPVVRTEWRRMSPDQQDSYIAAIKCMLEKTAEEYPVVPAASNRYEDFVAAHISSVWNAHYVGAFYPWHRWLLSHFEQAVQSCGFEGGLPYWDWTLDTASEQKFLGSPIFDAVRGFGGNGEYVPANQLTPAPTMLLTPRPKLLAANRTGGGCLVDGPFAGLSSELGPRDNLDQMGRHCVTRDLGYAYMWNTTDLNLVNAAMKFPNFGVFGNKTEFSYHAGGHWAIGGEYATMSDMWASPLDPVFWLHHSNIDRAWWSWETRDLDARVKDISGPLFAQDYHNKEGGNYTIDSIIRLGVTNPLEE